MPSEIHSQTLLTDENFDFSPNYDIPNIRALVPVVCKGNTTYLNASMQHPIHDRVRNAINEFLDQAQTKLDPKPQWQAKTEATRELLGLFLNVSPDTLSFTRDTTEGMNLFQRSVPFSEGDNVVLLDVEHVNQVYGWMALKDAGLDVRFVPTQEDACATSATFMDYVNHRTRAIGLSSVMFHSGQMNNIKEICDVFRPRGIHILVDLTQHIGIMPIDLVDLGVSAAAFSCHKALGCPTGLGVLYIDPDTLPTLKTTPPPPPPPMVSGGAVSNMSKSRVIDQNILYHNSTRRYEHMNPAFLQIAALHASLRFLIYEVGVSKIECHFRALGRQLILAMEPIGVEIIGSRMAKERAPHIYVLKLSHPAWQAHFKEDNIALSHYYSGTRLSFGFYNNMSDIASVVSSLQRGVCSGIPLI
ncbi:pyridoxal phosphate-dependent transferase [Xylogone sp. PMI_703]|nr:pyridoxal phosphate-dependent transferase [Xylogone sp. PMI_703]